MPDIITALEEMRDSIAEGTTSIRHMDVVNAAIEYIEELQKQQAVMPEPALREDARELGGVIIENINIYYKE